MSKWHELERRFTERLNLTRRPVGVTFLDAEPTDIGRFSGTEPAGCGFWRRAAQGDAFYTVPADHYNCPIGSYTHNISLPAERSHELTDMLNMMFSSGYLRAEEVPGVFKLQSAPRAIAYAPLGDTGRDPSVVLFVCRPNTAMLLNEAATRAGAGASLPLLGRPTCMALPAAMNQGTTTTAGCVGNRVYTALGDDELYVVVPGTHLEQVAEALDTVAAANAKLADFARSRMNA
ncbi:MAG TPA: DUF169 domain-containing protein [Terriglobia bacterium]|nr:DUF169 domain-containing protein [Terriglobia bacterium]